MNETNQGLATLTKILVGELNLPAQRNRLTTVCAELLDVRAAALVTLDMDGEPELCAASEETAELLTRFELAYEQGPGTDAFRTGDQVVCVDLRTAQLRWPRFASAALDAGVAAAFGLPCRLRDEVVGALTLYMDVPGHLSEENAELTQGLVDTVSLGVTAQRGHELAERAEQLQGALDSRVLIEQAKGMLAERQHISVDDAFMILRDHARHTGTKINKVARNVIEGMLIVPSETGRNRTE
jgi:transcriptional regulator with GAF, ATPase, and Fis domain